MLIGSSFIDLPICKAEGCEHWYIKCGCFCSVHWQQLSAELQKEILDNEACTPGFPSFHTELYHQWVSRAIEYLAIKEGKQ